MDPVTTAAIEAGRRYLVQKLIRWTVILLPVVLVGSMALAVYGTLLLSGEETEDDSGATASACRSSKGSSARTKGGRLSGEQVANAKTVVAVGRRLKVPEEGLVVALITALQESNLQNIPYGDRDSVGLFQQRNAWGSTDERLNPATSATMFFTGGRGGQSGLLDISNWKSMDPTVAAQAVQVSAFPTAYAKWESTAIDLLGSKGVNDARCESSTVSTSGIVQEAQQWLGTPYSWGGGGVEGPSEGFAQGAGTKGFDCSSLVQNAVYGSAGILLPRTTGEQARVVEEVSREDVRAGDLLFFGARGAYHHVGIADGKGGMIHAPRTGKDVERTSNVLDNSYWGSQLALVGRVSESESGERRGSA